MRLQDFSAFLWYLLWYRALNRQYVVLMPSPLSSGRICS